MEIITEFDTKFFLWLNGFHNEFMDSVMLVITNRRTWIPLYLLLLVYLYRNLKRKKLLVIFSIIITVSLADFVTSGLMKPFFERLRPCYNAELTNLVHVPGKCGGRFGFASSHAANTFSLLGSLLFILGWKNNWTRFMLVWAVIVSYSRIYVGVHYPADIVVGMLVGFLISLFIHQLTKKSLNYL